MTDQPKTTQSDPFDEKLADLLEAIADSLLCAAATAMYPTEATPEACRSLAVQALDTVIARTIEAKLEDMLGGPPRYPA